MNLYADKRRETMLNRSIAAGVVTSCLFLAGIFVTPGANAVNCSKNPDHPSCSGGGGGENPPPSPDGAACVSSAGVFPAFAFVRHYSTGKRRNQVDTYQLWLANSTGECEILVHETSDPLITLYSYRQSEGDGPGRIVFGGNEGGYPTIKMLDFTITGRAIDQVLPLIETEIFRHPNNVSVGINDLDLSTDGTTVFFTTEEEDGQGGWLDTLHRLSIGGSVEELRQFSNEGVENLSVSADSLRVFYTSHRRIADTYQVAYVEDDGNGSWIGPIDVVNGLDYPTDARFRSTSVGEWDYDQGGDPRQVLAITVESPVYGTRFVDVLDVTDCVQVSGGDTCIGAGTAGWVRSSVQAREPASFTLFPSDGTDPPNLLAVDATSSSVIDVDLEDLSSNVLVAGEYPEPAN